MQGEEAIGWDPATVCFPEHPITTTIYLLFLLLAVIATVVRLVTIRKGLLPSKLSQQANASVYLKQLQACQRTLKQWMGCAFLGWGIVAADSLRRACNRVLESRASMTVVPVTALVQCLPLLILGLYVALFLFLLRWYVLERIEYLFEWDSRANR